MLTMILREISRDSIEPVRKREKPDVVNALLASEGEVMRPEKNGSGRKAARELLARFSDALA
jgi:hypothetical protein